MNTDNDKYYLYVNLPIKSKKLQNFTNKVNLNS